MKIIFSTCWLAPLLSTIVIVAAFVSVSMALYPLPYYLSKAIPYALLLTVLVVIYQLFTNPKIALKTLALGLVPFALSYLWFIQTV